MFLPDEPLAWKNEMFFQSVKGFCMGRHTGHYCKPLIYVLNSSLICSLSYKHAKLQINMVYLLLFYMAIVI